MSPSVWLQRGVLALVVGAACGLALAGDLGQPGTQRVCVPSEDGRGWECGTKDNPPPPRGLRERPANADPAPPPFLAHPEYQAAARATAASEVRAIAEPEPVTPAPAAPDTFEGSGRAEATADVDATVTAAAEPAAAAAPATDAETEAEIVAAPAVETASEPMAEPAPVAMPSDADLAAEPDNSSDPPSMLAAPDREPIMLAPGPAISGGEPPVEEAPIEPLPAAPPPSDYVGVAMAGDFLALDSSRFTVQLARASAPDGFDTLLARLAVSSAATYRIAMGQGSATTWVLLWGDYADIDTARQAARALPADLVRGAWPRKIGPLQDEARRSGVPVGDAIAASDPVVSSAVAAEEPAATAPAAPAPAVLPRDAALSGALDDAGADAFLTLPAPYWTVQLASASDALAAQAIAASAGIEVGTIYVLRLNPAGTPTWVVVAGAHADLAGARTLQARIAGVLPAASVRRIGPLQTEVRAAAR